MAHYVDMSIPKAQAMNADVEFHAHSDTAGKKEVIGKLLVSKGGVEWVAKHKQKGIQMTWTQFAKHMENSQ